MKSSITKINARYRGPTSQSDYMNVFNQIFHDLSWVKKSSTEQASNIKNNLYYITEKSAPPSSKAIIGSPTSTVDNINNINSMNHKLELILREVIEWEL